MVVRVRQQRRVPGREQARQQRGRGVAGVAGAAEREPRTAGAGELGADPLELRVALLAAVRPQQPDDPPHKYLYNILPGSYSIF